MAKRKTFSLPNSDISLTRRKRSNTPASDALRVFESNWNRQSMAEYGRTPGGFVTHPVTPPPYEPPSYDSDALAYFTAVETAGGSFDLSAVDGYDSDFSAGVDGFVGIRGTSAFNETIGGESGWLKFTVDSSASASHYIQRLFGTLGENYEGSIKVYVPSSNALVDGVRVRFPHVDIEEYTIATDTIIELIAPKGTATGGVIRVDMADGGSVVFSGNGTDVIYIKAITARNTAYATYTESYIKEAHSNFYAGLKTDGVWDKLTEFYLLAGKTFGGLTVKGKGTGTLTNNNFVTGDYLGVGTGAGLTGDASTKYLDTGFAGALVDINDTSISAYKTAQDTASGRVMGFASNPDPNRYNLSDSNSGNIEWESGIYANRVTDSTSITGDYIATARSTTDRELYERGSSVATNTNDNSGAGSPAGTLALFSFSGGGVNFDGTLTFAHVGTGLTDTDASNLSTRVNTLMTALGCNVY